MNPKKNPMPTQEPKVRARNFDEVALGYDEQTAVDEALRCLNCKNIYRVFYTCFTVVKMTAKGLLSVWFIAILRFCNLYIKAKNIRVICRLT